MKSRGARVAWFAGTRVEILLLGPLYLALDCNRPGRRPRHQFIFTGEQGMAAVQAIDYLGLAPHDQFELRHPAEDPAMRLRGLMTDIESVIRRRRATHVVFTGFGPTAAAAALVCHGRGCRGLWLQSPDPAGVIDRFAWESGLARVIQALAPRVRTLGFTPSPVSIQTAPPSPNPGSPPPAAEFALRAGAPLILIAVGRSLWGMQGVFDRLIQAAGAWAGSWPEVDWLLFRTLDARLEGPLKSMRDRPSNLLGAPPLPYPEYAALRARAHGAFTDSVAVASEFLALGRPVAVLGETAPTSESASGSNLLHLCPDDLDSERLSRFLGAAAEKKLEGKPAKAMDDNAPNPVIAQVESWIAEPNG